VHSGGTSIFLPSTMRLIITALSTRCVDKIKSALNAFDTLLDAIQAPIDASKALFDVSHSHFEVFEIVGHPQGAFVDSPK
jgi:hypothetical protein